MSDVRKFLNQEVSLKPLSDLMSTKVDFNKCAQTVAVIAVFGVIPAFTYGTVLGTLDGQRIALMEEVSGLQAQVISSMPKSATTTVVHTASTDKTLYALGSSTTIYFHNNVASTTNVVTLDLYNASNGTMVQRIVSMIPYAGQNKHTFTAPSSVIEKGNAFFVRVTASKYGQYVDTNKFEIRESNDRGPIVSLIRVDQYMKSNLEDDLSDDLGVYNVEYEVMAWNRPVYIEIGAATRGVIENNTGVNFLVKDGSNNATSTGVVSSTLTHVTGGVIQGTFVKLEPYASARFKMTVIFDPAITNTYRVQLYSVNYSNTAVDATTQVVLTPAEKYQTSSLLVQDAIKLLTPPKVTLTGSSAVVQFNAEETASDDQGNYAAIFTVDAKEKPIFIKLGAATRGTALNNENGVNYVITSASGVATTTGSVSASLVGAGGGSIISDGYVKIDPWSSAKFKLNVYFDPSVTNSYRLQLHSVNYSLNALKIDTQFVLLPTYNYQTEAIVVQNTDTTPLVSVSNPYRNIYIERKADVVFGFMLTNPANKDVYISRDGFKAFAYETSLKIASSTVTPSGAWMIQGDTKEALVVKAGSARQFYNSATVFNRGNQVSQSVKVKKIYFTDNLSLLQKYAVTTGLDALQINATF